MSFFTYFKKRNKTDGFTVLCVSILFKFEISCFCESFLPWVPKATRLINPAGETSVRSEVSEASEGPNASNLWWRTPMVSLCLIKILYLITDWLFKNVFLPATAVGQKRSREMNRFFQ